MTEDSNNAVSNSFLLDDDSRSVTAFNYVMRPSAFLFCFASVAILYITSI